MPQHIWKHLPAIALLLLFIGGWLSVPVSLVMPAPITCGMECCEDSGECCCFLSRRAIAQDENGSSEQSSQLVSWQKSCPSNCAAPPSFGNHSLAQKNLPSLLRLELMARDERLSHQEETPGRLELCHKSAPRAPPVFS
ncbi:MAG: hypothetical protein JST84_09095 [Acidobacteria bacterium]|nr:hypothetical protein [Acidobacteriota bacterium]